MGRANVPILTVVCKLFLMSTPPIKPIAPPPPASQAGGSGVRDPQITVIPESYYGVALHLQPPFSTDEDEATKPADRLPSPVAPVVATAPAPLQPPPVEHHSRFWMIGLAVFVVLAAGGAWVAWNRDLLFGKTPAAPIVVETPVAPNAPTDLTGVSSAPGTVRLNWQDRSQTEAGFRVERKAALDLGFSALQTLPANSVTFLDPTAPPGTSSTYRVIAFNPGGDSTSTNTVLVGVMAAPEALPPAPVLPPDGLDLDSDGLTNTEEGVYGSNPQLPDSDADGYLDGNEVFNLYAPTVKAPASLLTSAMMQVVSSTVGWQTIAPKNWTVTPDAASSDVRIQSATGELFLLRMEANPNKQEIHAWLAEQKRVRADQVTELMSNKYGVRFYLGPDRLTGYVPWGDRVLTVTYQLGAQSFVNYRTTFGMILNALRLSESPKVPDLSQAVSIPPAFQITPTVSSTAPITGAATTTRTSTSTSP